jgi:hypothetical protein
MKSNRVLVAVSALLCSTALVQAADMPQKVQYIDDAHPIFTLTGTVGAVVMDLPDGGGLFRGEGANDPNDLLLGGTVGISGTAGTGPLLGGLEGFVGFNAFATYAYGDFNKTSNFTGPGVVVMQGGTGPYLSTISIATSSDATSAHADIYSTHTNPGLGGESVTVHSQTNVGPGGEDLPYTSNSATGGTSFQWGGGQTRVEGGAGSATAYAALADANGGVFIAAGNLDGLNLTQNYKTEALYTGGDVTFGVSGQNGTTTLQGYVGPSYRYLAQRNAMNSDLFVDVPEYEGVAEFPYFSMTNTDEFSSHYMGGIAGLQATIPTSNSTAITLGVEGGVYYTMASLSSDSSYAVWDGNLDDGGAIDPSPDPGAIDPPIVVDANGVKYEANTIAFAVRGTAAYTMAIAQNAQLTFSGSADYLSAVAQTAVNASVAGYDGDDNGTVTYESGGSNNRIAWGQMLNLSGSVSLTGQF